MPSQPISLDSIPAPALLDAVADAVFALDGAGRLRYANPAAERLTGLSASALRGRSFEELPATENSPPALDELRAALAESSAAGIGLALRAADGSARPCELSLAPLPDGMLVLARDVSALRAALAALEAERDRYLGFLETAPLGIMALNSVVNGIAIADARRPKLPIVFVNAAFERLTGYSAEETLGKPVGFLLSGESGRDSLAAIDDALAQGRECRLELRYLRKDGGRFWSEMAFFPICDGQGALTHFLVLQSDITERKSVQAELERLTAELQRHRDDLLTVLDQFPSATLIVGAERRIVFASASSRDILGADPDSLRGRRWDEALPIAGDGADKLGQCAALPAGERRPNDLHWTDTAGTRRWLNCRVQDDPRDRERRLFIFDDVSEIHRLREQLQTGRDGDMIGASEPMRRLYRLIGEVARGDWTVLIEGETGTGKELVARAVHQGSPRRDKPFVAMNAAGLSESLLASQLFGHRRGAFTGAISDQAGYFEAAEGGTLFLDEIGDLPLPMQASLLRVLQEREITRLGETCVRKIDVRIIAASHRNLAEEARAGRFREDLLFRLRVARLHIPPLRERRTDIALLADTFLRDSRSSGKPVESIEPAAMRCLLAYDWPGNVRELKACIEYAVVYSQSAAIRPEDLPPELQQAPARVETAPAAVLPPEGDERARILAALQHTSGNCTKAARLLGISRATFYRRLDQFGLKADT